MGLVNKHSIDKQWQWLHLYSVAIYKSLFSIMLVWPAGCPMDERCIVQDRTRLVVVVVIAFKCTHNQLNLIKIAQSNV